MNWKQQWINQVLEEIPDSGYRARMEAELRDHLEAEYQSRLDTGRTPQQAQEEALGVMGEPEKLQAEYRAAWRNTLEAKAAGVIGWFGALFAGGFALYAAFAFTYIPIFLALVFLNMPTGDFSPAAQNGVFQFLTGTLAFWVPHTLEAGLLRGLLGRYRRRTAVITAALLTNWAAGTYLLMFMAACIKEVYLPIGPELFSWWLDYMPRSNTAWITPQYLLMNVLGCILLGLLFGRASPEERKKAPA